MVYRLADEELVAWLPGRLLLEAARNAAAVHSLMDGPLRAGIFPAKMSLESQARQWAAVYLAAGERERRALRTLLRGRSTVQAAVMRLLQARAAEAAAEDPAHRQVELKVISLACLVAVLTACMNALDGWLMVAGSDEASLQSVSRHA